MYKYLKKKYADQLFNENIIRIGTLNWYKDMEKENKGRADPLEGTYEDLLTITGTGEDYYSNSVFRQNVAEFIHFEPSARATSIKNLKIVTLRESPNYLIFCSAHTKSVNVLKQFKGADTCFHIYKPDTFFQLITWALEKQFQQPVKFLGVHPVSYKPFRRERSAIDLEAHIHPVLAKTEEFEPQCELRGIWEIPQHLITKPYYDLQIPGLRKFCRIVDL